MPIQCVDCDFFGIRFRGGIVVVVMTIRRVVVGSIPKMFHHQDIAIIPQIGIVAGGMDTTIDKGIDRGPHASSNRQIDAHMYRAERAIVMTIARGTSSSRMCDVVIATKEIGGIQTDAVFIVSTNVRFGGGGGGGGGFVSILVPIVIIIMIHGAPQPTTTT